MGPESRTSIYLSRDAVLLVREAIRIYRDSGEQIIDERMVDALEMDLDDHAWGDLEYEYEPKARSAILSSLSIASCRSHGIWRNHFDGVRRLFEPSKEGRTLTGVDASYVMDPAERGEAFVEDEASEIASKLNKESSRWRAHPLIWPLSRLVLYRLLAGTYVPVMELAVEKADFMTRSAVDILARSFHKNTDVLTAFGSKRHMHSSDGVINRVFLESHSGLSLILGMQLLNASLDTILQDIFNNDRERAAVAVFDHVVYDEDLLEFVFDQRLAGYCVPSTHGRDVVGGLGGVAGNFLRGERSGSVETCERALEHLITAVRPSDRDCVARHARLKLLADLAHRASDVAEDSGAVVPTWYGECERNARERLGSLEYSIATRFGGVVGSVPSGGTVVPLAHVPARR